MQHAPAHCTRAPLHESQRFRRGILWGATKQRPVDLALFVHRLRLVHDVLLESIVDVDLRFVTVAAAYSSQARFRTTRETLRIRCA